MLPQEFDPGMKKLLTIFSPRGWDEDTSDAYYAVVRRWTQDEWDDVVDEAIRTCDWMPRPKKLLTLRLDLLGRDSETGPPGRASDCDCCFGGLVQFTVERSGMEYERVCACTCDAGQRQLMNTFGEARMMSYLEIFHENPPRVKGVDYGVTSDRVRDWIDGHAPPNQTGRRQAVPAEEPESQDAHEWIDDKLPF